jgi:hypothetical protein
MQMISWNLIGWRSIGAAALLTLAAACGQPNATPVGEEPTVSDENGEASERGESGEGGESGESGASGEGGNSGPG